MQNTKICSKCKETKKHDDFHKKKNSKDGLISMCKSCKAISDKAYYFKNREKRLAHNKEYYGKNKEEVLLMCKKYREENKEQISQYKKEWAKKNRERKSQQEKAWREKNPNRNREMKKNWYKLNRDRVYSNLTKRRTNKNFTRFEGFRRTEILNRDNWTCQICGVKVHDRNEGGNENRYLWDDEFKAHIDHIIPLSKGGDSTIENLRVLCRTCNLSKSNKSDLAIDEEGQIKFDL